MSTLGSWDILPGSSGVVCIHTFQLPDSRLVCVERPHENPYPQNANTQGIPATEIRLKNGDGQFAATFQTLPITSNAFCGGHAMLGDGSILVVGGDERQDTGLADGRRNIRKYIPCLPDNCTDTKGQFTELYQMSTERWYPTVVTLEDGSAMIISGTKNSLDFENLPDPNPTYEYYPQKDGVWPKNLAILEWAFPFVLYPMGFQLPSGSVFLFVANKTVLINPKTDEISNNVNDLIVPNHFPFIYPYTPTMVMLPLTERNNYQATLLLCGGSDIGENGEAISSKKCFKISPHESNPVAWEPEDDMPVGRVMLDSVILPDGKILILNGAEWGMAGGAGGDARYANNPVFKTTLYDPEAPEGKRWSLLADSSVPRLYHSGAILTPDGYVITTGSEMQNYLDVHGPNRNELCYPLGSNVCQDPYEYRLERYTPYYLSNGKERPVIVDCPTKLTYQSKFLVEFSQGSNIEKVTLVRYATTTHSTNTDQRLVELRIYGTNATHIGLTAPSNGAVAPPGNWMLFILHDGTPSVARVVHLTSGPQTDADFTGLNPRPPSEPGPDSGFGFAYTSVIVGSVVGGIIIIGAGIFFGLKYKAKKASGSSDLQLSHLSAADQTKSNVETNIDLEKTDSLSEKADAALEVNDVESGIEK